MLGLATIPNFVGCTTSEPHKGQPCELRFAQAGICSSAPTHRDGRRAWETLTLRDVDETRGTAPAVIVSIRCEVLTPGGHEFVGPA